MIRNLLTIFIHATKPMKVLNTEKQIGLKFIEEKSYASYFNYYSKPKVSPYAYIYYKNDADIPLSYLYFPRIYKVYPDTIHCGSNDTLNIKGKYFLSNQTLVKFGYTETAVKWTPYNTVLDTNIILMSDTLIQLRVPCQIKASWGNLRYLPTESSFQIVKEVNAAYPTNGKIKYLVQKKE